MATIRNGDDGSNKKKKKPIRHIELSKEEEKRYKRLDKIFEARLRADPRARGEAMLDEVINEERILKGDKWGKSAITPKNLAIKKAKKQVEDAAKFEEIIKRQGIKPSSVPSYLKKRGVPYKPVAEVIKDTSPASPAKANIRSELLKQLKSHSNLESGLNLFRKALKKARR